MDRLDTRILYTIGHSNHPLEHFIHLLQRQRIELVADVRSHPVSRFAPQFNKKNLDSALPRHSIDYRFLGRELGARPDDPAVYREQRVSFTLLSKAEYFKAGIESLISLSTAVRTAVMCAEKDPLDCHRTWLISALLVQRGLDIRHILGDGTLETHSAVERRLMDTYKPDGGQLKLFEQSKSHDILVQEAAGQHFKRLYSRKNARKRTT